MSNLKKIFLNPGSSIACGIISFIFMILPDGLFTHGILPCEWDETWIVVVNKFCLCVTIFLVSSIIYINHRKKRKSVSIASRTYEIVVQYGDITDIKTGKKIIHFDECFTTTVGERPEDIKADSVCGQYLTKHRNDNIPLLIEKVSKTPSGKSKFKDTPCFASGTIIPNGEFLLMAFAKLDEKGLGHLTYNEFLDCLDVLWEQIDEYRGTDDIYVPILGSRITRFDRELTQQDLLNIMIASYRLHPKKIKLPNKLHIVCQEREGFSLNDIIGVD